MESTITVSAARRRADSATGISGCTAPTSADGRAEPGAVVRVAAPNGRFLARAFFSDRSQITLRILTRHDVPVDRGFWRARLEQAISFRERLGIDATAYRLVHGEGDLIPSLIVDRYGDYLVGAGAVAGHRSAAARDRRSCSSSWRSPKGILARNDPRVRLLEGLEQNVAVLHGDVPDKVAVREGTDRVRRRSAARPEDRRVSRSAREPHGRGAVCERRGRSTASATPAASRCSSRRTSTS